MRRCKNQDMIVEVLELSGKRVVDVGCGDGHLTRLMASQGASVLGVECSPRQLAKARAHPGQAGAEVVEGVGQALPVADGSVDVVLFAGSLHHVPPDLMDAALAEAVRVLMPGGHAYVQEPLAEGPFFETGLPVDDETEIRRLALAALNRAPGLEMVREIRYLHPIRLASFEDFQDRMVSANVEREERFAAHEAALRALFEAKATRSPEGDFCFDQPMRVNLARKPLLP